MLQLLDITVQLGEQVLMDQVGLQLGPRERVALVGRNGAGKSTLMKAAAGLIAQDSGEVTLGRGESVAYLQQEHLVSSDNTLWEEVYAVLEPIVAMEREANELFEKAAGIEDDERLRAELLERAGELHDRFTVAEGFQAEARCGRVLSGLGFQRDDWEKRASEFSGGKQVTIGLARLLLERPRYLLLDEPTNHLDIETRTWLLHELRNYPGGLLLTSHDRDFLDRLVSRTVEIARGKLTVYSGGYTSYRRQQQERMAHLRARAESLAAERVKMEAFIRRFRAKASKAAQVQSRVKMLEKMEVIEMPEQERRVRLRFPDPPPAPRPLIEVREASKGYDGLSVLEDIELAVYPGERILLVGANGAGKSTLLRLICGEERPDTGNVRALSGTRQAWFAQDQARELQGDVTVLDATLEAAPRLGPDRARSLLGALLFRGDDVHKRCSILSGGEKSRVALGRVLLKQANLLLLDEPTNHLDIESKDVLADALEHFTGTILFVSHDREFANRLADTIWEVGGGSVKTHRGNLDDFLWNKAIAAGVATRRAPGEPAPDHWLLGGLPEGALVDSPEAAASGNSQARGQETPSAGQARAAEAGPAVSWKEGKRLASLRRRQEKEAESLMEELETLEDKIAALDKRMADPDYSTDWDKLEGWSAERRAHDRRRAEAYERWGELDELLKT